MNENQVVKFENVDAIFVMGGISTKSGTPKPYVQLSNGLTAEFFTLAKEVEWDFSSFKKGETVMIKGVIDLFTKRIILSQIE